MTRIDVIRQQLHRSLTGEAWFGPGVLEHLAELSAAEAAARPMPYAHTIWEIVLHLEATYRLVVGRLQGEAVDWSPEEDWPPVRDDSAAAWNATVAALERAAAQVEEALDQLDEARLDQPILEGYSSAAVTLHGLAEHNACHAGQIALLRKSLGERKEQT